MELVVPAGVKKKVVLVHHSPESAERVIRLVGEGASVEVEEIFLAGNVSSKLSIVHEAPRTSSRVNSRGIAGSLPVSAHAKIVVPKHAVLSDTFVSQRFLLLDEQAQVDALPSLEIEADEVKAGHAAALSQLSRDAVFYLTSRGLSDGDARRALVEGFVNLPHGYEHLARWQ
ncbi:SufD family Fe-S cluster assembly protein [Candidatus Woesearchaeota archaeon]|nr:SufD family Fe-S cluster assembly protein [Candidatus Woesearchaeota archaeon]